MKKYPKTFLNENVIEKKKQLSRLMSKKPLGRSADLRNEQPNARPAVYLNVWPPTKKDILGMGEGFLKWFFAFYSGQIFLSRIFRANGRLVSMPGDFCTNNAQAPSLFSNVTSRRTKLMVCETVSGNSALD